MTNEDINLSPFIKDETVSLSSVSEKLRQKFLGDSDLEKMPIHSFEDYKLSSVLYEFVAPYVDNDEEIEEEEYYQLFSLATLAWNCSFLNKKEQKEVLDKLLVPEPLMNQEELALIDDIKAVVRQMIVRKKRFFAKYKRFIVDFELENGGDSWNLAVLSHTLS